MNKKNQKENFRFNIFFSYWVWLPNVPMSWTGLEALAVCIVIEILEATWCQVWDFQLEMYL